jgi:hypothetical protein
MMMMMMLVLAGAVHGSPRWARAGGPQCQDARDGLRSHHNQEGRVQPLSHRPENVHFEREGKGRDPALEGMRKPGACEEGGTRAAFQDTHTETEGSG